MIQEKNFIFLLLAFISIALNSCKVDPSIIPELPADNIRLVIPDGFGQPAYSFQNNPLTTDGFILGRRLFYDTQLSKNNTISCGSCHQQFAAFSHLDHPLSHGIYGKFGTRNAPTLFNLIWQNSFMWDGGINHLEVQPLAPITNPVEMDETMLSVIKKLSDNETYRNLFKRAFNTDTINSQRIFFALAQFMGMLNSYNSRYDQYVRHEAGVFFTDKELQGLNTFRNKCASCHQEPLFTDNSFRNNGLSINKDLIDTGRIHITQFSTDFLKFKVPTLRNVELSRPYMHDGRFKTLEEVLNHYSNGITNTLTLDTELTNGIALTAIEKQNIIAFLKTLTDNTFIKDKRFNDPFFK